MSRHSNNTTSRPISTAGERAKIKEWGTIKAKVMTEAHKKFEQCSLCLCRAKEPHACQKGHIFCRICVFENLVAQKKENERLMKEWQLDQVRLQKKAEQSKVDEKKKALAQFKKSSLLSEQDSKEEEKKHIHGHRSDEKRPLLATSYWCPQNTPTREEQTIPKPSTRLVCPADRIHQIKVKNLLKLVLDEPVGKEEQFSCFVCQRAFKYQPVGALKSCGHVFCLKCLTKYCLGTQNECQVCSKPCSKKDVLTLEEGKTGFAGHNEVETVVTKPVFKY